MPDRPSAESDAVPPQDTTGSTITAYLISGPALFGGIGWAFSYWLGTLFPVVLGLLIGMGLAIYVIWVRYGMT